MADLSDAKRRIVERLKRLESATAPELAGEFGLTDTAIRQHLESLEVLGVVERSAAATVARGRPPVRWQLAPAARDLFPDRHGDLTVDLIESIRTSLGDAALAAVVRTRADRQLAEYQDALAGATTLRAKVRRLAEIRTAEGYLAEAGDEGAVLTLTEHHCPIHDAARACPGLCAAELELFQETLGADATVARSQHLLGGAQRCSYTITPSPSRR